MQKRKEIDKLLGVEIEDISRIGRCEFSHVCLAARRGRRGWNSLMVVHLDPSYTAPLDLSYQHGALSLPVPC